MPAVPPPDERPSPEPPRERRLRPDLAGLVFGLLLLVGSLPLAASSPLLLPLVLLPLAVLVWVLRAKVVVTPEGLAVCNGLGTTRVPWDRVEGVDVPRRGPVRLLREGAGPLPLTAVQRGRVRELLEAAERAQGVR